MSCAVSASITSVILCIAPCFISMRMTSTARSDMRLASSWMVIASGMITSRISFSFGSFEAWPFSRWVRRRNEAIERSRTSSALSAVTTVRRPRSFCRPGLWVVLGAATGRAAPPGPRRIWRGPSSSSGPAATAGARPGGPAGRCVVVAGRAAEAVGRALAVPGRGAGAAGAAVAVRAADCGCSPSPKRFLASISAFRLASSSWR